jgi:hypothetical protein
MVVGHTDLHSYVRSASYVEGVRLFGFRLTRQAAIAHALVLCAKRGFDHTSVAAG